jgi:predicted PurR-regulated permease PerM
MDAQTVFAWLLAAVLTVIAWLLVQPFLSWLLATGLLAFLFFPLHQRLEDRIDPRLSAGLLSVLVVLVVVVPLVLGGAAALARGTALLEGVSEARAIQQLERLLTRSTGISIALQSPISQVAEQLGGYLGEHATSILGAGLHAFLGFLLLVFVLYYLLKDGRAFVGWLRGMTPLAPDIREELFASINDMAWAVLKGHILVAIVQGFVAGLSLILVGIPEALLLTVAMMLLAIVPLVGVAPVLGGAAVYLLLNGRLPAAAFVVVWGLTAVALTDDYLRAWIIDRESKMHPAVVFVGVLGGTYLLGPVGLFVGPILAGLFRTGVEVLGDHYGIVSHPR